MSITIRDDFRKLIQPLKAEEKQQLHDSLLADGKCRDPLVVWKGKGILLDGHHRYDFCTEHDIPFDVVEQKFSSEAVAKNWIILNQLGRRNLDGKQASFLRGKLYNSQKQKRGGDRKSKGKSCTLDAAEQVANQTGVSPRTVKNDAEFADAVTGLGAEEQVMNGSEKRSRSEIINAA